MSGDAHPSGASARPERVHFLRRGVLLEGLTVGWNVVEGVIAVAAGALASSVALIAFGVDSFVETTSGAVLGWRLLAELRGGDPEYAELNASSASRRASRARSCSSSQRTSSWTPVGACSVGVSPPRRARSGSS